MNRRRFLATLGAGASGLALSSGFAGTSAANSAADSPAARRRLLVFFTRYGAPYDAWKMRAPGLADAAPWQLDLGTVAEASFSEVLRPLYGFRDRTMVVDGVALVAAEAELGGRRPDVARSQVLTGGPTRLQAGRAYSLSESFDQRIANVIARPDHWRSIELAVGGEAFPVNYRASGQLLWPEPDIARVRDRLFGRAHTGDATASALAPSRKEALGRLAERYAALAQRVGVMDRQKVEAHRAAIVGLQSRLATVAGAGCAVPELPTTPSYASDYEVAVSMIASAFSCDLTRVVTLHLGPLPNALVEPGLTGDIATDHAPHLYDSAASHQVMARYATAHAEQLARLLRALDGTPTDTGTLLDETTCVWVSDMADSACTFEHWPVVVVGGPGAGLELGKYVHYPSDTPMEAWTPKGKLPSMGLPHQKLLVTLCRAFGVKVDAMDATEVIGRDCALINCRGPLPGLG